MLDDLVITILTGRRLHLLRDTVGSLPDGLLSRAYVICSLNGDDPETADYLHQQQWIDVPHALGRDEPVPIGDAVSSLARQAAQTERAWWMHLEDDWLCSAPDLRWLVDAARILTADPSVGQVRLRSADEPVMRTHMVTRQPLTWEDRVVGGVACRVSSGHFTFNPTLVRTKDIGAIYPASHERIAARRFLATGLAVAQLVPGVFRHLGGGGESLRRQLGR